MKQGLTKTEAEAMVNGIVETKGTLGNIPRHTRGRIIEALNAGDHWNVLVEWDLPHISAQVWYDKYDVQNSMHLLHQGGAKKGSGKELEVLEIRSSHDLAAPSSNARRTGAHSYQVDCSHFTNALRDWENDKVQHAGPIGLTTLGLQRIWITAGESRRVVAAIEATRYMVALD